MALIMRNEIFIFPFDIQLDGTILLIILVGLVCALLWYLNRKSKQLLVIMIAVFIASAGLIKSVDYIFNSVLEPHQSKRINVMLGLESDPKGAGYNVNQSLIAIGSGGISGKGFWKEHKRNTILYQNKVQISYSVLLAKSGVSWKFSDHYIIYHFAIKDNVSND